MSNKISLSSSKGNLLKSEYQLEIDNKTAKMKVVSDNILKQEEEYKTVKTEDIVAVRSNDSGFQSLKAIFAGIIIFLLGVQFLQFLGFDLITQITFTMSLLLILYGIQRAFDITLDYHSMSQTLPISIAGSMTFEGSGALPINPRELASTLFPLGSQQKTSLEVRNGLLGPISYTSKLIVSEKSIAITTQQSQITPSSYIFIPLKNIISINVAPTAFRSLPSGIFGALLVISGVYSFLNDSIFGGIITLIVGLGLAFYGFARMMKTTFLYSINGLERSSVTIEGEILNSDHDPGEIGEIVMGAVVELNNKIAEEVPAK